MAGLPMIAAAGAVLVLFGMQDPDLATDYRRLQERLHAPETGAEDRLRMLRGFLEQHEESPDDRRVLAARSQLAGMLLELLQATAARMEFAAIREISAPEDHDLHGRALYGIAQAQELEGDLEGARATLRRLLQLHEGTRYARYARVALSRLMHDRELGPGAPLPDLLLGEDLEGRTLRRADLRGQPFLLVFFDPDHDASRVRLEALHRVWRQAGQPEDHLIGYALGTELRSLRTLADRFGWSFPVLRAEAGFLHHDLLALGVTGVPTSFLVGSEGRLLARDLPPDRLATVLARARGG